MSPRDADADGTAGLEFGDVLCRRPFGTLFYVKGYPVTLSKGLESRADDGGVMNKNVLIVFSLNEAETLLVTEPLYGSFCHDKVPPFLFIFRTTRQE
jgi:hypothetical protein